MVTSMKTADKFNKVLFTSFVKKVTNHVVALHKCKPVI